MIIWVNGTFGVGKTTTARLLADTSDQLRIFDPEHVGYMVQANLRDYDFSDFQQLAPWRQLVSQVLHQIAGFTSSHLIAPQTVLVEKYWDELRSGMADWGLEVFHVVLDGDEQQLRHRIEHDEDEPDARQWRLDHLATFAEAKGWLAEAADLIIDTSNMTPEAVVGLIRSEVAARGPFAGDMIGGVRNDLGQPTGAPIDVRKPELPSTSPMEGEFCRLVPLNTADHGEDLYRAYTAAKDGGDWTYLPYGPFETLDSFQEWLTSVGNLADPMFFTIVDRFDDAAVGVASYLRTDRYAASTEVGHIHLSRRLQKTPAATEAMFLMMNRVFDDGYRRYEWKCDDRNGPSRSAATRLGFRYEGTFRQATHYKGRNRDTAWYSIIDREWPAIEAEFTRWLRPDNFDESGQQCSPLRINR